MNDFEKFAQYWNEAVNGLVYGIRNAKGPLLTRSQLQEIWREELLHKRFFSQGLRHGARVFLDELAEREPEKAEKVSRKLRDSKMPLGVDSGAIAGKTGGAALAAAAAIGMKHVPVKVATAAAAGGLAASAVVEMAQSGKNALVKGVEQEAAEQLRAYQELLGAE